MISTIIWRVKEAFSVFIGKKKTLPTPKNITRPPLGIHNLPPISESMRKYKSTIDELSIEFIFSEFKEERVNAGGADLAGYSRLDPSLSTLKHYFPNAKYTVYSDFDLKIDGVDLQKINTPALENKNNHPRYFYHLADYYKFQGMLNSKADIAISIDSDMFVFSEEIYRLIILTKKFGFCVPNSSALSMNFEIKTSLDTVAIHDDSNGFGTTVNITPMTFCTQSIDGKSFYEECCKIFEKEPSRASIVMWKAAWNTSKFPYLLPKEFCVCRGSEGIGNEVLLHVGHPTVANYYNIIEKK
ncbi:MAG: hypothetical protein KBS61_02860 [Chryseobacterium sp.]|nr:hypothetical protein [Candidatus Chryseobacterium enterohippi]